MEQLSYWNRPMVLALFGAEIILSAILIILSSLTTVNSLFVVQAWVVFYAIPLAALVLISSITHFVVIARSNAILGAVVLVNFIWTIDILVVTAIFGISSFSFDGIGGDGFMIASFVFSLLACFLSLAILIVSAIAYHRYQRDINSLLMAFKNGELTMAGRGPKNA